MSDNNSKKEIDEISGVETTGHEWDGIKELNNPAPRWWLWIFYISIVWSIIYWVLYPAWPTPSGSTEGLLKETQFTELKRSQASIRKRQAAYLERFEGASFDDIMNDTELYAFAVAGGKASFKDNCATCHGTGGAGAKGYPNLNDDDWIWGGTIDNIHETISYGIRSEHDDSRISDMPAFGKDELLERDEMNAVVDYVLSLSGGEKTGDVTAGGEVFQEQCAACHGEDAKGGRDFGAPNLNDAIWLYGGEREDVFETVSNSRSGLMPNWNERLDANTIRQLTVYVHQLGGGEGDAVEEADTEADVEEVDVIAPEMEEQEEVVPVLNSAVDIIDVPVSDVIDAVDTVVEDIVEDVAPVQEAIEEAVDNVQESISDAVTQGGDSVPVQDAVEGLIDDAIPEQE